MGIGWRELRLSLMGLPVGRAPQRGEGPALVAEAHRSGKGNKKPKEAPGAVLVKRRHIDWTENQIRWRWLLDSYEGGQRYRDAQYGPDRRGLPARNLTRHKREYPDPQQYPEIYQGYASFAGSAGMMAQQSQLGPYPGQLGADPSVTALDDDYEYRRSRTPVPEFVAEAIEIHGGKMYDQDIVREGPPDLVAWWRNVSGSGRDIDEFIREDVYPLLMALGNLDVCFDRPVVPPGVEIKTKADEIEWNQHTVVAFYIVPENMVWWRNDPAGNYLECLVREYESPTNEDEAEIEDDDQDPQTREQISPSDRTARTVRWRHWTEQHVTLYSADGEIIEEERLHGYPCVPIVRLIDQRKHRTPMVGKSRYEAIAEYQREYYNRDSELILSDTLQAHPVLSGPEDACKGDQTLSVGPGNILPKMRDANNHYEGWEFVSPPKDPAESLRRNKQDIVDMKDRRACLMKPAGVSGTSRDTVGQSGFSKQLDMESGGKVLGSIAKTMARVERQIAEFALMCMWRRVPTPNERAAIRIAYPSRFQLKTADAILDELLKLVQALAIEAMDGAAPAGETDPAQAGGNPALMLDQRAPAPRHFFCPTAVAELIRDYVRAAFVGRSNDIFQQIDGELLEFLKIARLPNVGQESGVEAMAGHGSEEAVEGEDRTGRSGGTMVGNIVPAIV